MNDKPTSEVVYTTSTGEEPKGGPSRTKEATEPLPPPVKRVRKTTTKKVKPRVVAPAEPLSYHHRPPKMLVEAAKAIVADDNNTYTRIQVRGDNDVVVR